MHFLPLPTPTHLPQRTTNDTMEELTRRCVRAEPLSARFCSVKTTDVGALRVQMLAHWIQHMFLTAKDLKIVYLLPIASDIDMATSLFAGNQVVRDGPAKRRVFTLTYRKWLGDRWWTKLGTQDAYLFIMDMGLGHPTADMFLSMATIIDWAKGVAGCDGGRWTLTVWTITSGKKFLTTNTILKKALGTEAATIMKIRTYQSRQGNDIKYIPAGGSWSNEVAEIIRQMEVDCQGREQIFVVISAYEDARRLSMKGNLSSLEFESIGPWSTASMMKVAVAASAGEGRILHVNRDTGILPPIKDLRAVFVAPYLEDYTFDAEGVGIVEARIAMPDPESLVDLVVGGMAGQVDAHVFEADDEDPSRQSTPASMDKGSLYCGLAHLFPRHARATMPVYHGGALEYMSSMECLWDYGLLDEHLKKLNFQDFSLLLGQESNTAALILLDSAMKMPASVSEARLIRIEMAMLLSQGLSSILDVTDNRKVDEFIVGFVYIPAISVCALAIVKCWEPVVSKDDADLKIIAGAMDQMGVLALGWAMT